MKVWFRQTGGIAGQVRGCEVNGEGLDESELRELKGLVEPLTTEPPSSAESKARDVEIYEFRVEQDDGSFVNVSFDESVLTERLAPLVEFVQDRSGPRKLEDPSWPSSLGAATEIAVQAIFFDIGDTLGRAIADSHGKLRIEPIVGALASLEAFQELGFPLGVVSNTPSGFSQEKMDALLEECGMLVFFGEELRVYSSVVGLDKSTPEIFELTAGRVPSVGSSTGLLYIGEDSDERANAEAAGWNVAPDLSTGLEMVLTARR
ncbi:MAG: hypothetical protein GY937_04315 [bacterium]|nr:hypothetical protein [bacterium]